MKSWLAGNRVPPIHDVKAGAPGGLRFMCRKESLGLRHPLKSAIAAVLAVAMLVPTASAAPSVVLPNGTDGNAPTIAAADLVGNAEPEGIVDGSTIIISNYRQLTAIGTGVPVTDGDAAEDTFGTGRTISDEAGSPLTYALDATYRLAGTISMPQNGVWQLPAGFAGTFETPAIVADPGLYDQSTDTLYVHNVYQLAMLAQSDAADQPVMSNDAEPSTFGMGQPVMKADGRMLTYGGAANVALAMDFTTATPQGEAGQITLNDAAAGSDPDTTSNDDAVSPQAEGDENTEPVDPDGLDGRDYVGQVTKEINDTTYILIGNEQQLRAIGTGKEVVGPVWMRTYTLGWGEWGPVYPGDADIDDQTELLGEHPSDGVHGGPLREYCGVDDEGNRDDNVDTPTGLYYVADTDYIIFRDIDLNTQVMGEPGDRLWTPLMFSGRMFGADGSGREKGYLGNLLSSLDAESTSVDTSTVTAPTISHVTVNQTGKMDSRSHSGIGFFGTISSAVDTLEIGHSAGTAVVSNINLDHVSVTNASTETESTETLIRGLTDVLSDLLGGVLSGLSGALSGLLEFLDGLLGGLPVLGDVLDGILKGLNDVRVGALGGLGNVLKGILDLRKNDPTTFATGAFAGRIVGDVNVNHCTVTDAKVENAKVENAFAPGGADSAYVGMTGGFVGYMEGQAKYDGLSKILGATVDSLKALLNIIPGIGLGDLLELLSGQGNLIDLDKLIPVGYYNPIIDGCKLTLSDDSIGTSDTAYAGGFVGLQIGSIIKNSSVSDSQALTVNASEYAGGFAGLMRDAEMDGLLQNLGVDLGLDDAMGIKSQSLVLDSFISLSSLDVKATNRAGGFAGAMAASYAVDSSVVATATLNVSATASYAGGFAGQMTMGWATNLGVNNDLLGTLSKTVTSILGSSDSNKGQLLTLAGFEPSAALGCGVSSGAATIAASGSYAGGFTGAGEGAVIAQSDADHVGALTHWRNGGALTEVSVTEQPVPVTVSGLSSVSAKALAGGIAGEMETAAVGGLLNKTLGIGSLKDLAGGGFTAFEVSDAAVTGVAEGFSVTVGDYTAGGAIGQATGGSVARVTVSNIKSVSGNGEVGGFIGQAAAGDTLGADGIDLLRLVQLSGLLSVAQSTRLTVNASTVSGIADGFTVTANGDENADEATATFTAGGFYGRANSTATSDAHVIRLKSVTAPNTNGDAGGFVGLSATGGLASIADDEQGSSILEGLLGDDALLSVDQLLGAVPYMVPTYKYTDVAYVDVAADAANVAADVAGGFAGSFESGEVNILAADDPADAALQTQVDASPWAVRNINSVVGQSRAGGFAGTLESGSLADAGGGLSLLGGDLMKIEVTKLLSVLNAYIPSINQAGVSSVAKPGADGADDGFIVSAAGESGAAGGFVGYASGAQISYSNVSTLRRSEQVDTTSADPDGDPDAPVDLSKGENAAPPIASNTISYAVIGGRYAGGYVGHLNIGSSASIGDGLKALDGALELGGLVDALQVVVSTIEHSDVNGQAGGFAVLASSGADGGNPVGMAGGFAGLIAGGHIQDSNAYNFITIVGQETAGGYAGQIEPGNVANVIGDGTSILSGLLGVSNDFLAVGQDFVPSIRNSETTAVPCGGEVIAMAYSDGKYQRGIAGGYVGHNVGGQIWGKNTESWKKQVVTTEGEDTSILPQPYDGPTREAAAIRIRTVWGAEYAGGFTGLMEAGDTAQTGGLSLLWGLVTVNNLLGALPVAYATEENTAVYGPLAKLDVDTWNSWVEFVGQYGGYGQELAQSGVIVTTDEQGKPKPDDQLQAELQDKLSGLVYGVTVTAGRMSNGENVMPGASAGGYVGSMVSGTITNGQSYDIMSVNAMKHAGGFAGEAIAGGAASLGSTNILGHNLNLGQLLDVAQVFVPVIKNSSTTGWRSGMTVTATGTNSQKADASKGNGMAGGYIGYGAGVQIWGDGTEAIDGADDATGSKAGQGSADGNTETKCNVINLRRVRAPLYAGGFAGNLTAGSAANVNTDNASSGFLQDLLDKLVGQTGLTDDFVKVLQGTMSTVRGASVEGFDEAWGFTVDAYRQGEGDSDTVTYPAAAGGFAGKIEATVIGKLNNDSASASAVHVRGLRGVDGGLYAGGFVGLADVGSIADVSGGTGESSGTSILDLIMLGNTSVLDVFQPCIYGATVTGPADGITVRAHEQDSGGLLGTKRMSGNAGGFAGTVMSGTVQDSVVDKLNAVTGPNYTGGFIGYTGKTGVADAEEVNALKDLIGLNAGIADVFGAQIDRSSVEGVAAGYTVSSTRPAQFTDSEPIAGGFIGYADLAHVADCHANNLKRVGSQGIAGGFSGKTSFAYLVSAEVDSVLVDAVLQVVKQLLELLYSPELQEGHISVDLLGESLTLEVLNEDGVLKVTLLGLDIAVSLAEGGNTLDKTDDVVKVIIGDSEILLSCGADGKLDTEQATGEITVNLIKGNRSVVEKSSVTGIAEGYDVFGGGATQSSEGIENADGYAGGFVGFNNEGKLSSNKMLYADTIRGAAGKTGPFTGVTQYSSNWWFNKVGETEQNNEYHVYRDPQSSGSAAYTGQGSLIDQAEPDDGDPLETVDAHVWNRYDVIHRASGGKDAVLSRCSSAAMANDASCNIVTLNDWQDAYTAGYDDGPVEERRMLDVYRNEGTTAVLMADTPVSDNTGGLTPEPGEGQDPCGEEGCATIDLTVRKIWDDEGNRGNTRPDQIKYDVYMSYTDASGKVQYLVSDSTSCKRPFDETTGVPVGQTSVDKKPVLKDQVLSAEGNASEWSETWHDVIGSLPVGFWDNNGTPDKPDDDEFRYYTYSVKEQAVPGYVSSLDYDSRENVATITNGLVEPLPDTGGTGVQWIIAVGLLLAGSGLYWQWVNVRGASCGGKRRGRHRATT